MFNMVSIDNVIDLPLVQLMLFRKTSKKEVLAKTEIVRITVEKV